MLHTQGIHLLLCVISFQEAVGFSLYGDVGGVGERCRYDADCYTEHAYCYHHEECACKDGFIVTDDYQSCIAMIGGICQSKHDCSESLLYSECVEEQCACVDGYVAAPHRRSCLPAAFSAGESCEEDIQCSTRLGDASRCHDGTCVCYPGHHFTDKGTCDPIKKLGEPCLRTIDCNVGSEYVGSVDCVAGTCQCRHGFHQVNTVCIGSSSSVSQTTDQVLTYIFVLFAVYFTVFY